MTINVHDDLSQKKRAAAANGNVTENWPLLLLGGLVTVSHWTGATRLVAVVSAQAGQAKATELAAKLIFIAGSGSSTPVAVEKILAPQAPAMATL